MKQYVALLRGINVGGKNLIKMTELRACFEAAGYGDVVTYIQSGNVLFTAAAAKPAELVERIEAALAKRLASASKIVLRTHAQLENVVGQAPDGFGTSPAKYRYDVIFLKEPMTAATAIKSVPTKPGVDQAHAGIGALYFSRLVARASQSRLSRVMSLPIYQSMTIRNWNTTTKLLELMEARAR